MTSWSKQSDVQSRRPGGIRRKPERQVEHLSVTVIEVDAVLPAASHALALIVCVPELTFFVFQVQV